MYGSADLDQGSFASHAVWNQNFVYHVPDALESVHAAPLMCGGATVFNALHLHGLKPSDRVGVIGVGGLGHLAIQFAAKMGCTVAVFSGSDSKKDEAMKLGATEFYAVKGVESGEELKKIVKAEIEYLLVTTSSQPDWSMYQPIMASGGTICVSDSLSVSTVPLPTLITSMSTAQTIPPLVSDPPISSRTCQHLPAPVPHSLTSPQPLSVSSGDLVMPYTPLIEQGLRIQGFLVADRLTHQHMLAFAARHAIHPIIQTFPLNEKGIEEAFGVLESGKMRYRGVLVAED